MKTRALVLFVISVSIVSAEIPDMPAEYRADPKAVVAAANAATSARFPDADRVMVDDRIHVAYQPDGSEITWDDEWQKVLTEKGRRAASTITLDFTERYGDAQIFSVEIVDTNGQIRAVDFARTLKIATPTDRSAPWTSRARSRSPRTTPRSIRTSWTRSTSR